MVTEQPVKNLWSDIAPLGGRIALESGRVDKSLLLWNGSFSLGGSGEKQNRPQGVTLKGKVKLAQAGDTEVWVELETSPTGSPLVNELFLAGSRPLPGHDITCMCRHPLQPGILLAATGDARLLWLDANLTANLNILSTAELPASVTAMVCSGSRIVALAHHPRESLVVIDPRDRRSQIGSLQFQSFKLNPRLIALAENDGESVWGLNSSGTVYMIRLGKGEQSDPERGLVPDPQLTEFARLRRGTLMKTGLKSLAMSIYRAFKNKNYAVWSLYSGHGSFQGFAYDGRCFWASRSYRRDHSSTMLFMYNQAGDPLRGFTTWPEVSVTSLNFAHNSLMVVDRQQNKYHQYHLADAMQPIAGGPLIGAGHPGYLTAGDPAAGGIHNLCLLYAGGQGTAGVHRYDIEKLRPLTAYVSKDGTIQDRFMDGFLILAQYSPLLNGRAFAADLKGPPSRREDWMALFDEYFRANNNLAALEKCAEELNRQLPWQSTGLSLKIVLAIPTPDQRCIDWDQKGGSLADPGQRIEAIDWAMQDLIMRWSQAQYQHLRLAGFYCMVEQGAWNDPVLQAFPVLCRKYGVGSFAIPGIYSSWLTEFKRAGFSGIALQSSHAFQNAASYPHKYLLKCAAGIAREFGMGMEVELPYNVMEPGGREKLRDYLDMAKIQGWAGAFKAYFQSYNLIYDLAVSVDADCRQLYDDLYAWSRCSYHQSASPLISFQGGVPVKWQGQYAPGQDVGCFRLNIEGYMERFDLTELTVK